MLPPPPRLPPVDCLSEDLLDLASMAARDCQSGLAYGFARTILQNMTIAEKYGKPLDPQFVA